jgi:hypothetical protein
MSYENTNGMVWWCVSADDSKKMVNSTKNSFCPIPYWDYLLDKKAFSFISTRKNALVEDKGSGILHVWN